ncbi:hypothetical protein [Asticcacaulis taihuensis]|uniref:hypothetical protein n=1 Tax=Asticcacaulis taihuensis TaxID=260084 RepID=UPI003F7C2E5D
MAKGEYAFNRRLRDVGARIDEIANEEARQADVNGPAARGELAAEKMGLIDQVDEILNRLEEINRAR